MGSTKQNIALVTAKLTELGRAIHLAELARELNWSFGKINYVCKLMQTARLLYSKKLIDDGLVKTFVSLDPTLLPPGRNASETYTHESAMLEIPEYYRAIESGFAFIQSKLKTGDKPAKNAFALFKEGVAQAYNIGADAVIGKLRNLKGQVK
jgi:hypothetical protein